MCFLQNCNIYFIKTVPSLFVWQQSVNFKIKMVTNNPNNCLVVGRKKNPKINKVLLHDYSDLGRVVYFQDMKPTIIRKFQILCSKSRRKNSHARKRKVNGESKREPRFDEFFDGHELMSPVLQFWWWCHGPLGRSRRFPTLIILIFSYECHVSIKVIYLKYYTST